MKETSLFTRTQRLAVIVVGATCILLPLGYGYHVELPFGFIVGGFGRNAFFYLLAFIPGAAAVIHHVLSRSSSHEDEAEAARRFTCIRDRYLSVCGARVTPAETSGGTGDLTRVAAAQSIVSGVTSALLLTSVFLLLATLLDYYGWTWTGMASTRTPAPMATPKNMSDAARGFIAAGLGAYVSVVYYMTARIYANALSSRFISASALRAAFSVAIGAAAGCIGVTDMLPSAKTLWGGLFLVGLFQNAAYNAIRSRANTWFGATKAENDELPLDSIQGVDDTMVDLLREYGISTIQQLSAADVVDLSTRTLIPLYTLADWADQAALVREVQRKIAPCRLAGVRAATDLARIHIRSRKGDASAVELLKTIAQKTEFGEAGIDQLAWKLESNAAVRTTFEFLNITNLDETAKQPEFETRFTDEMRKWIVAKSDDQPSDLKLLPIRNVKNAEAAQ